MGKRKRPLLNVFMPTKSAHCSKSNENIFEQRYSREQIFKRWHLHPSSKKQAPAE
jgi:hypothetical protein